MAIKHSFIAGKPFSALPNITFFTAFFYYCHPPVIANKNYKTNRPLNTNPKNIYPS